MHVFYQTVEKAAKPPKRPVRRGSALYYRLKNLSTTMQNAVSVDFVKGIRTFKRKISSVELQKAWASGDYSKLQKHIPWQELPEHLLPLESKIREAAHKATAVQIEALPANVNSNLRFDVENPRLRNYLATRTASLVVDIDKDAKEVIQRAVTRSFVKVGTPRDVANQIKDSIGLLPAHQLAVERFRQGMIEEKMAPARIESLSADYADRLLDYRAMNIARTETRGAVIQGQLSVWREGANQGYIDPTTTKKTWFTADAPCPVCEPMHGVSVPLDEDFILEDGTALDGPPAHPSCLCGVNLDFSGEDEG